MVSCAACKLEFHTKCQGVSDLKHEVLFNTDDVLWFCKSCRVTTSNVVSKLSQFELKFAEVLSNEESLKKEMSVMHNLITSLNERNKSLEKNHQEVEEKLEKSRSMEERFNRTIGNLYNTLDEKDAEISKLTTRIDQLEQSAKAKNLRIAGVAENEDEKLTENIIQLVKNKLNISDLKSEDIKECHRMGKRRHGKHRDILVQFQRKAMRDLVYQSRKRIPREDNPVFFNDDLIPSRGKLFYHARKFKKSGKVFGAWSQGGSIMVKVKEEDSPVEVQSDAELNQLVTKGSLYMETDTRLATPQKEAY